MEPTTPEYSVSGIVIVIAIAVVAMAATWWVYSRRLSQLESDPEQDDQQKQAERRKMAAQRLQQLADEAWMSYQGMQRAIGRAQACTAMIGGDGGIEDIAQSIQAALDRYGSDPQKQAMVIRERDAANLLNLAVARGFYSQQAGWKIPAPLAAGFANSENYLDNLHFEATAEDYESMAEKLRRALSQQKSHEVAADQQPSIAAMRALLPIISQFADVAQQNDDETIAAAKNFVKTTQEIIYEFRHN